MGEVWINGVHVGYTLEVKVKYAEVSHESLHRICPMWPPDSLSELERANHWRPVAENEARVPRPLEGL